MAVVQCIVYGIVVQPRLQTCRGPGYSETGTETPDTASCKFHSYSS